MNTGTGEYDLVGNATLPAFYTKFVPGSSNTTGTLYYRVRVGKGGGGSYPKTVIIGIDADQDGKLDLFVGEDNEIRIWKPIGTPALISPATIAIDDHTVIKKYARNGTNYKWAAVNSASNKSGVTLDPAADTAAKQDLNSNGNTDYFISFSLPFSDLVAALASRGIIFNSTMPLTYVLGTSSDPKSIKQDLAGVSGGVTSTIPFASLGVLTQPMLVDGTVTNRAPVNTVPTGPLTVNASRALTGVSVADLDCNLASVQVTASTGTVSVSLTGGAVILAGSNNSATFALGGTLSQINAALATLGYTAPGVYVGTATVTLLSKDSSDATASSNIPLIVINTTNTIPVAANDSATTHSGKAVTVYVIGNDVDPDANILKVTLATLSAGQGTVSYADGNVTYTPTGSFVGTAIILYSISDGNGGTANATLTVTVAVNRNPVVVNDSKNANVSTVITIDVLANDSDPDGDPLTITGATRTSGGGTVAVVDGMIEFTAPGAFGTTTISYTVSDGYGGTASGTLTIVTGSNSNPVAMNDNATAHSGVPALIDVLANDTDANGDSLAITDVTLTAGDGVALEVNGKIQFSPDEDFTGTATISYTIDDGRTGTATGTLTVTVTDATPPKISGTFSPLTLSISAGGTVTLPSYVFQAVTTDNVGVTSVTQWPAAGSVCSAGLTTVTLTASDAAGNTASVSFDVIVTDAPVSNKPVTLGATRITPRSAILNARLNPGGVETQLSFEYSKSVSLNGATATAGVSVGSGTAEVGKGVQLSGLEPNTHYYYRAVSTSTAGVFRGEILSFLTPVIVWGPAGAPVDDGQLDATRIPNTAAATTYANVSGRGYDVLLTTSSLGGNGHTSVTGESSWWLQGSPNSSEPATVRVRFYETGTRNPFGIMGVRFQIDDAEQMETLMNFSYYTENGESVDVPWNSPIFTYSHTPAFSAANHSVENGAPYEGMTQSGKWVDVNLSGLFVSGFEFQLKRRTSAAGSVIMGAISAESRVISVAGNFTPTVLNTDASGFAVVPDYTRQAIVSGAAAGVVVTQNPAPGTPAGVGKKQISICAQDAEGHRAQVGFEVMVCDKTAPVVSKPAASWTPAALTSPEPMPDFTGSMNVSDNVAVTLVQQSPAPGTMTSMGTQPVTITARDAAGNTGTFTFQVTAEAPSVEGAPHYSSIAAKGSVVPVSSTIGVPAGAVFKTFGMPSINDAGATAFIGKWAKGTQTGKAIFAGSPLRPVAGLGRPAPDIAGATFSSFRDPVLNNGGTSDSVAFLADVTDGGITQTNNTGVWTNLGGQVHLLAREYAPAPGTTALFKSFTAINLLADEVLITATLVGSGVDSSNDAALWSWTAERGMELILREGQSVLEGKTLATIQILTPISGSMGHGRHHLDKGFHAARITCTDGTSAAIFIDCTGSTPVVLPVAASRSAIVPGATATSVGTPSGNAFGSAAFTANLSTGPALIFSRQQDDGSHVNRIVARRGDAITPDVAWYSFRDPVMNAEDGAAWLGQISGAAATDNDVLAFTNDGGGNVTIVAREGAAAPGTDSVFNSFTSIVLPDGAAGPLFSAALRVGTGSVTTKNDTGLWAVSSTGEIVLLVREGDALGSRIIRSFQTIESVAGSPGQARSYNATGAVIVLVTFTDGSQSIVQAEIP